MHTVSVPRAASAAFAWFRAERRRESVGDIPTESRKHAPDEDVPRNAVVAFAARVRLDTRLGAVDGMRGLAILLVLAHHYGRSTRNFGFSNPLLSVSEIGWIGVDLFFVLSGFLITGILNNTRDSTQFFSKFYTRRALRILPLYYGAFLLVSAIAAMWPDLELLGSAHPLWTLLYMPNIVQAIEGGYATGILGHFWSLAIEEHFYIVWPLVVFLVAPRRQTYIAVGMIAFSTALRVALRVADVDPGAVYTLTFTRLDGLAIGALCSLVVRSPEIGSAALRHAPIALAGGGVGLLLIALLRGTVRYVDPVMGTVGFTCLAIGCGGALLTVLGRATVRRLFESRVLRWFGTYSYGIYVWHPIVNGLLFNESVRVRLGMEGPLGLAACLIVAFGLTLVVSQASYVLLERPLLQQKRRFSYRRTVQRLAA